MDTILHTRHLLVTRWASRPTDIPRTCWQWGTRPTERYLYVRLWRWTITVLAPA